MQYKAVIFDLDGTLYDNTKLPRYVVLHSLFHLRYLYSERLCRYHMSGRFYGTKGATYKELFRRISVAARRSEDKVQKWYWGKYMPLQVDLLERHFHKKAWVDGTLSSLRAKGIKLACFSEYSFIREKLKAIGISPDSFDLIVDAPTAGGCKPCRKAFLYLANKLECAPEEILMVGDREDTDGAGAEAANMGFVLVPKNDTKELNLCD
ncbi:MAG: HAD family hydrolase [Bacteroidales bacterium]|nr:HAD family hydrolase [Candidatus Hennigimonas equi]